MKAVKAAPLAAIGLLFILALNLSLGAEAACNPVELSPCLTSFTSKAPPSAQCCAKLHEQEPCFCQYIHNPAFAPYISNPEAKTVMRVCNVSYPKC
uniref:Bifunctional inhibitor/plant lipid transfer protein/seed storage helical domain-containing protein n=1 Tax=Kalanchoe fedtschenkoi TaxID=63787 RepID=A0A7N0VHA3_KALFE